MDRRELSGSSDTALLVMLEGWQSALWTALPGIIQSFNPAAKTCVVQVALKMQQVNSDGTTKLILMPPLLDCPVQFPGGGGTTLTFPLAAGDECLVVFASRCIDAWWQSGCPIGADGNPQPQPQVEFRMHDPSDGFVIPGVSSKPNVQPAISTTQAELRSNDGTVKVTLNPTTKAVTIVTPGAVTATAGGNLTATAGGNASISATGDLTLAGTNINLNGIVNINGHAYTGHVHSDPQGGNTGGVV